MSSGVGSWTLLPEVPAHTAGQSAELLDFVYETARADSPHIPQVWGPALTGIGLFSAPSKPSTGRIVRAQASLWLCRKSLPICVRKSTVSLLPEAMGTSK